MLKEENAMNEIRTNLLLAVELKSPSAPMPIADEVPSPVIPLSDKASYSGANKLQSLVVSHQDDNVDPIEPQEDVKKQGKSLDEVRSKYSMLKIANKGPFGKFWAEYVSNHMS
ncbi:hypothetical protein Pyn_37962 [Prunus yedoensis var. nudiflora]|uniref:Uncharacterized protein n=1 Tax=Prunus yedoensis var. nudiflora TaxID=2094558 RepID=A0A314YCV9_PRUYE|nr:hypothetical protein Pyn_37962 [Prunus yedoensis var. nudiflora]